MTSREEFPEPTTSYRELVLGETDSTMAYIMYASLGVAVYSVCGNVALGMASRGSTPLAAEALAGVALAGGAAAVLCVAVVFYRLIRAGV